MTRMETRTFTCFQHAKMTLLLSVTQCVELAWVPRLYHPPECCQTVKLQKLSHGSYFESELGLMCPSHGDDLSPCHGPEIQ